MLKVNIHQQHISIENDWLSTKKYWLPGSGILHCPVVNIFLRKSFKQKTTPNSLLLWLKSSISDIFRSLCIIPILWKMLNLGITFFGTPGSPYLSLSKNLGQLVQKWSRYGNITALRPRSFSWISASWHDSHFSEIFQWGPWAQFLGNWHESFFSYICIQTFGGNSFWGPSCSTSR